MKHYHDTITDPTTTAERCRFLRQRIKWNVQDVADRFGYTRAVISYLENGSRPPSRTLMECYKAFFGCSYDWLMEGEGSPPPLNPQHLELRPTVAFQDHAQRRAAQRQAKRIAEDDQVKKVLGQMDKMLGKPTQ